ncbi:homeodomain-like superfamily protein [Actinidia rufa]|uniref:Homeodomain-like superfamily protein n=1 Tax=Actinidia rufa TaxID=165716 RepID=A0A7J0FQB2_9ERIC|nr:homeodomain-like superfamily protein [Actinidia rufa]
MNFSGGSGGGGRENDFLHMMMKPLPLPLNPAAIEGGDDGDGEFPKRDERVPQWSQLETRDLIAIRAELERDFTVAKRNKTLWEVVSARMRELGYRRTADQCKCKWKNLVNRYKASTTAELSLCSKLGGVSVPELGRGTTVGGDPNGTLKLEGNLHDEVFSDTHTPRSRCRLGRLLPEGKEDSQDITIRRLKAQTTKLQQFLVANNLVKPAPRAGEELFEVRVPPSRIASGMDFFSDPQRQAKLRRWGFAGKVGCQNILPARSESRTTKSTPKEQLLQRYQTPFALEIEGMNPPRSSIPQVHHVRREVRPKVAHQPLPDGALELSRCIYMQGVSIKPGGHQDEMVRQGPNRVH